MPMAQKMKHGILNIGIKTKSDTDIKKDQTR